MNKKIPTNAEKTAYLKETIRVVKDYPREGVNFKDVSSLLRNPLAYRYCIEMMAEAIEGVDYDSLAGQDVPGLFGITLAHMLEEPFIMMNKRGTLPGEIIDKEFNTEYSVDEIEINPDLVEPGEKVLITGYLIATSGTAKAMQELIEKSGGEVVGFVYFIKQNNFEFELDTPLYYAIEYED